MRVFHAILLAPLVVLAAGPARANDGVTLILSVNAHRQLTVSLRNDSGLDICPDDSGRTQQLEVVSEGRRIAPVKYVEGRPVPGCNSNVANAADILRKGGRDSETYDLPYIFTLGPQTHGTVCLTQRYRFLTTANGDVGPAEDNWKRACAEF